MARLGSTMLPTAVLEGGDRSYARIKMHAHQNTILLVCTHECRGQTIVSTTYVFT